MSRLEGWGLAQQYLASTMPQQQEASVNQVQQAQQAPVQKTKSDSGGNSQSDLVNLIKNVDALPSDFLLIQNTMSKLLNDESLYDEDGSLNSQAVTQAYLATMHQVTSAKHFKEQFKDAQKEVIANGGLNEWAITPEGQIVVQSEQGITFKSPEEIFNSNEYQPLTNSELLQLRASNPNYAGESGIFSIVNNGIGQEKITKLIQQSIKGLGSTTSGEESYSQTVQNGLNAIQEAINQAEDSGIEDLSVENLFRNNLVTKDQSVQINEALRYIWQTLPTNARTWLKTKSDGTNQGALMLITSLLNSNASYTTDFDTRLQQNKTNSKSKSSKKSNTEDSVGNSISDSQKLGSAATWLLGNESPGNSDTIVIQDGTRAGIPVHTFWAPITNKSDEALGTTTLNKIETSQYAGILDFNNASFGGQEVQARDRIVVDANRIYSMDLPIKRDETGAIKPNLEKLKTLEEVDNQLKSHGITDPEQINNAYQQAGLEVKYIPSQTGNGYIIDTSKYQRFGVMNAYATEDAFDENRNEFPEFVQEITSQREIDSIMRQLNANLSKEDQLDFDHKNWFEFFSFQYDHLYKAPVFIPVSANLTNALITTSAGVKAVDFNNINGAYQQQANEKALQTYQQQNLQQALSGQNGKAPLKITNKDY